MGATLAIGTVIGLLLRRGAALRRARTKPEEGGAVQVTGADLGEGLGERATLVQFSTAFCQPCRATRRVLADVAAMVPGVAHIEIDAESRLDLVRRFGVMRTPTVLVLDAAGRVTRRASGQPRKVDVIAALGEAIGDRPA
ncbi:thioredoxin family protein [Thermopolyspora sp. NPDC052614]|uniref:TlpA family protein disulfide reductase n=1 Tax=Thermopolyspora sp. NPDC052614 TaxID=3155682 RepID=UPI003437B107